MSDPATSTRGLDWSAQAFHCEYEHSHSREYVKLRLGGTVYLNVGIYQILWLLCVIIRIVVKVQIHNQVNLLNQFISSITKCYVYT